MFGYSPGHLVLSKDMIMHNVVIVDWEKIKQLKKKSAISANARENRSRLEHEYKAENKVLIIGSKGGCVKNKPTNCKSLFHYQDLYK